MKHINNISIKGNGNQIVSDSSNTIINNTKGKKTSQHWLQIVYWIVGIALAIISIYKFFIG